MKIGSLLWAKSPVGRLIEGGLWLLDVLIGFGLVAGAAVAVAFGKFLLGGMLGVIALCVALRFKRHRAARENERARL